VLPSGNEMPTGSSKLEIQVSRRFDFALLVGSFVHVSSLPPQALNHVGHRFSNRRNFRLVCVKVGGDALRKIECQREAANSKLKCREDLLLHYGFAVSFMSHLSPPNVKHVGHVFSHRRNFRLGCVEVERVGLQKMERRRETLYFKSMYRRDSILNCRCAVLLMSQLCFARQ